MGHTNHDPVTKGQIIHCRVRPQLAAIVGFTARSGPGIIADGDIASFHPGQPPYIQTSIDDPAAVIVLVHLGPPIIKLADRDPVARRLTAGGVNRRI